jgi:hypothetical protein
MSTYYPAAQFFCTVDQQVLVTEDLPVSKVWRGAILFRSTTGEAWVELDGTVFNQVNGLSFTVAGALCVFDASAGLPADAVYANGLPLTPEGLLCIDAVNAFSHVQGGIPFTAIGAVYVTFDGPGDAFIVTEDSDQIITEDGDPMVVE